MIVSEQITAYINTLNTLEAREVEELRKEATKNLVPIIKPETKELLKVARSNFEYAEDDLIDYYAYQIKAHQSKLDYLIKIAKRKGIVLNRINELKTR